MINIGTTSSGEFSIDETKHFALIGGSGMGKTTAATNLFIEHIRKGGGGLFIDFHGDAADFSSTMIPKSRSRDFIWFDPSARRVPPLNPLYYRTEEEKNLTKDCTYTAIKSSAADAWGAESGRVSISALDAVFEQYRYPTLIHATRFLFEDVFRTKLLNATKDPLLFLKAFQQQYDEKLRDSEQMSKFSPAVNKFSRFLRPNILPIIGQETSIDLLDAMNTGKIIVCRFSKGRLGEEDAQLLGSFMMNLLSIAVLSRERQKDRRPFLAFADEAQNAIHGGRVPSMLAESRKYGLSLGLGFQGIYQLPFAKDIFSNCATQIAYNVSGDDGDAITDSWKFVDINGIPLAAHKLTGLPRFQFYARSFKETKERGRTVFKPDVDRVACYRQIKRRGDEANPKTLIRQSLMRYSRDKNIIRQKITKFLSQ